MKQLPGMEADDVPGTITAEQRGALENFGFDAKKMARWSFERAATTLANAAKQLAIARNRAAARGVEPPPGDNPLVTERTARAVEVVRELERKVAADYLEQEAGAGADDLLGAVACSLHVATHDELTRLRGYLVRLWKGEDRDPAGGHLGGTGTPAGEDHYSRPCAIPD